MPVVEDAFAMMRSQRYEDAVGVAVEWWRSVPDIPAALPDAVILSEILCAVAEDAGVGPLHGYIAFVKEHARRVSASPPCDEGVAALALLHRVFIRTALEGITLDWIPDAALRRAAVAHRLYRRELDLDREAGMSGA